MPHNVVMPQLGLTMTEGAVSIWLRNQGDRIEKGEALFTVETDKVEMEVEATISGYLGAILVEPKQMVPTGTVIAIVTDQPGETVSVPESARGNGVTSASTEAARLASTMAAVSDSGGAGIGDIRQFPASPRARQLARELGIDLAEVRVARGSRIVEGDVRRFHESRDRAAAPSEPSRQPSRRSAIADRMAASFQRAPHFYLGIEINATEMVSFHERERVKAEPSEARLTYTDVLLRAMATALHEQPAVNSYWQDGDIAHRDSVDIGVALQTESVLIVPVIRGVDRLSLGEISRLREGLAEKARAGKLTLAETEGGSATLSNLGQFGIDWFQAILNPPQSVILAAGQIAKRPIVIEDRVEACHCLTLTLSVDHRALDGVAGAKFLKRLKELLEHPPSLTL